MTQSYPLAWPEGWARTPSWKRQGNSRFQTTFARARDDLLHELRLLGAKGAVISSNLAVRQDGLPYADAARKKIEDPGVAVYFALGERRLVMARDSFNTVHDNLRSIGLAVSHLRGLERHGGSTMMERAFNGFAALPPPSGPATRAWREVLEFPQGVIPDADGINARYRRLARDRHPDAGGSSEAFSDLTRARDQALKEVGA